jgi:hypothetical protein
MLIDVVTQDQNPALDATGDDPSLQVHRDPTELQRHPQERVVL